MKEEFKNLYRKYYWHFNKMLEMMRCDYQQYLYHAGEAERIYAELKEMQARMKGDK